MVGLLGATRNFLGVIYIGMDNILVPFTSKRYIQNGYKTLYPFLKVTLARRVLITGYCSLVSFFPENILNFLYRGQQYADYGSIIVLFAIQYFIMFMIKIPSYGVKAIRKPEFIFYSNLVAALVTTGSPVPLVKYLEEYGVCLGMIITQLIWFIVLSYLYNLAVKKIQLLEFKER